MNTDREIQEPIGLCPLVTLRSSRAVRRLNCEVRVNSVVTIDAMTEAPGTRLASVIPRNTRLSR